jgi:hypothetical protein
LLILKYFERPRRWHLVGLFAALLYLFLGSWYQMFFGLVGMAVLVGGLILMKSIKWRQAIPIAVVVFVAGLMTLPLAMQYMRFSKQNSAGFSIGEQVYYSASVADYALPNSGTFFGKEFYEQNPNAKVNSYNPDSASYHGYVMYAVGLGVLIMAFRARKRGRKFKANYRLVAVFVLIAGVGLIMSLGPLLKLGGGFSYAAFENYRLVVPMPYLAVDVLVPQLSFIRAIGRASILMLFALCALLAILAFYLRESKMGDKKKKVIIGLVTLLVLVEVIPAHRFLLSQNEYSHNLKIPAVYSYVKEHPDVDNLIVLRSDKDYPGAPMPIARTEDVLWAGYHNRNIFNGYSGYEPPKYMRNYKDFIDLQADDLGQMRKLGLKHVIIDKRLSTEHPELIQSAAQLLPTKLYEDDRYVLYRL